MPGIENARNMISSFLFWIQLHTHSNILSSFLSFISAHFNATLSAWRSSFLYLTRMQFLNSFIQIIAVTIPVLINFLQLKKNDPFSTHPRAMNLAVSSTFAFYVAYIVLLKYPMPCRFAVIADHCLVSFGNAAVASLASVMLPDSLAPLIYAIFGLLSSSELLHWLYRELVTEEEEDDNEFGVWGMRVSQFFNNIWRAPQQLLPL